jgi:tRNA(fMet)-specific endonuclease VapC
MTYALDTNIIIHLLRNHSGVSERFDCAVAVEKAGILIPPYANYEILRGFRYVAAPSKERAYTELRTRCPLGEMTAESWELAATLYGHLRRTGRTVSDADLLIVAFCVVNDCILATANTKDFEHIDGLRLANWMG